MNKLLPLMQREWLQYRHGWLLMAGIPLGIAALLLGFGQIEMEGETLAGAGDAVPAMLALAAMAGGATVLLLLAAVSSLIIVAGIARRDHADRSVEFWLSLPAGHGVSLGAPLLVHLLLVPAAALLVGLAGGSLLSLLLVGRVAGVAAWVTLPWLDLLPALAAIMLRLLAGLPLALLWLSPLILLVVLFSAWFRQWSWVILGVGIGLGSLLLSRLFGQPLLWNLMTSLLRQARQALLATREGFTVASDNAGDGLAALQALPGWALRDFGFAVAELASPLLIGALLVAAGCFALLMHWRQRGAGAAG